VSASANYSLGAGVRVEVMQTLGTATTTTMTLTGNELVNVIIGNAGVNALNGGAGADLMRGLAGTDTYVVDNAGDVVDEAAAGSSGIDLVQSSVSFDLSDTVHAKGFIDHVTLTGGGAINATGNGLNNTLTGNGAANVLTGRAGIDNLTGGLGNDTFRFDVALGASNYDTLTDFDVDTPSVADSFDTIQLENAIFTLLTATGDLAASSFLRVTSAADADNGRTITYVSSTGGLFYDTNGAAAGGATLFAVLDTGLALTAADFFVT
jgi:serralysin